MNDQTLADELITRLNRMIEDPDVRADLEKLIESRVLVSVATQSHPSIQCQNGHLGFLGLLNGLVGTIPEGRLQNYGYIAAVFDDNDKLERFRRTDVP